MKPLKPCPFCLTEGAKLIELWDAFDAGTIAHIHCEHCGADGPSVYGEMGAAPTIMRARSMWNARAVRYEPPEGCTPTDARMLRQANHLLAQESHELQDVLAGLLRQVNTFAQREGEADFETGPATDMLRRLRPGIDTYVCQHKDEPRGPRRE